MGKKVVIVGGVAGGASAAARLRRLDESAEIVILERGSYISFANCGLPYYIGGVIGERESLLLQTPEKMGGRFNIDVRINSEVTGIDRDNRQVLVRNLEKGTTYKESYDYLILATGSSPVAPPIPGIEQANIFSLWNIPDTDRIKEYMEVHRPESAVVVGGGFIGLEMAENLAHQGLAVSLVEMLPQVMAPLDFDMAQILHEHLFQEGIDLNLGTGVKEFEKVGRRTRVLLSDGRHLDADMVILAIGVKPNSLLAQKAGLDLNMFGGVLVDEHLRTKDPNIYAVGDVIEVAHLVDGEKAMIPLAGPANKQGRIAADNICGMDRTYRGSQGTSVVKLFDLSAASTGYNEKQLQKKGLRRGQDYFSVVSLPKSHAEYYPGPMPMNLKMHFSPEGKILGAQAVGQEGVDKRIDVLATVMRLGGGVHQLTELELAYAPPFSSAKDPVNMLGFMADNVLAGKITAISWDELGELDPENTTILDVREPIEVQLGQIPGAINIPLDQLRHRMGELDPDREIIVYCAVGLRGYLATRILSHHGYACRNLSGGFRFYQTAVQDFRGAAPGSGFRQVVSGGQDTCSRVIELDACGMQCPGPIMKVNEKMAAMEEGEVLEILATDPGFPADAQAWAEKTGNRFISREKSDRGYVVRIRKGQGEVRICPGEPVAAPVADGSSMVIFSGDLDKAIASFIIANGARAMGKPVTMFFTFWGLNILRKDQAVPVEKTMIERMFGWMMPRGSRKLKLSKMNMAGMGTRMIRMVMKQKNVSSLEELIRSAMDSGVKIVACTMSMDIMGIQREELLDGIEYAGVASYLGETEKANLNLFI